MERSTPARLAGVKDLVEARESDFDALWRRMACFST